MPKTTCAHAHAWFARSPFQKQSPAYNCTLIYNETGKNGEKKNGPNDEVKENKIKRRVQISEKNIVCIEKLPTTS